MILFLTTLQIAFVSAVLPDGYQNLTALKKQELLWNQMTFSKVFTNDKLPAFELSYFQMAKLLLPTYYPTVFTRVSDELENGRDKLAHMFGTCAKANFEVLPTSPYTGLFKAGTVNPTIIRPSNAKWEPNGLIRPGMGVKVLIDGQRSQNFVSLFKGEGQPGNNDFLYNNFSTSPEGDAGALSRIFQASMYLLGGPESRPESTTTLGLIEPASMESSGVPVPPEKANAPWKLDFVPNPDPKLHSAKDGNIDFRAHLSTIPVGTVLYTVAAYKWQDDWKARKGEFIGQIVTTSEFVASDYCDNTMFMQHSRLPNPPKPKEL